MSKERTTLSPRDWAEIEELWSMGEITLDEIAKRYNVTVSYLSRSLAERGVKKGSKSAELQAAIKDRVYEEQVIDSVETLRKIEETKDEHYKYASTLSKVVYRLIAQQIQKKAPLSAIKDDVRVLRESLQALQIARNERWAVLGLDKDPDTGQEATTLVVQEMTDEDIAEVRTRYKSSALADDIASVEEAIVRIDTESPENQEALLEAVKRVNES